MCMCVYYNIYFFVFREKELARIVIKKEDVDLIVCTCIQIKIILLVKKMFSNVL